MDNVDKTQNVCRICLMENNEDSECVFGTIDFPGESVKFSEVIMACTNVEVILGDELPDQICPICAQNTIRMYLFKIKCEESDKTLRNRFLVLDKIEIDKEDILDNFQSEIKIENEKASDSYCAEQIENSSLERNDYEDYDSCTTTQYTTAPCIPVKTCNNETTIDTTQSIVGESFQCDKSEEINDILNRNKVVEMAHKIKMLMKTNFKAYDINKDETTGNSQAKLPVLKKLSYDCDVCGKSCKRLYTLTVHKRTHTGERPYKCDVCEKTFRSSPTLLYHKSTHTGEKLYKCDVLEKKFIHYGTLGVHKCLHTGERPYKCNACETTFRELSTFMYHKRDKPYKCDV